MLADSRLAEAGVCFAHCAEDDECQKHQAFVLIKQHRYEEAASAIRRIRARSSRTTSADVAHAKALALIRLGDVQGAKSAIAQLSITTSTPVSCTAGAVYWMNGDLSSAANALHACAAFTNRVMQLGVSIGMLV